MLNPPKFPDDIDKKWLKTTKSFVDSRSPVGAQRARRHFAAISGSYFRKESYPILAISQDVGATPVVTILPLICCLNNNTCILHVAME